MSVARTLLACASVLVLGASAPAYAAGGELTPREIYKNLGRAVVLVFATDGSAPASVVVGSRTMRAAAVGVTFSTLASYARGRSRFPAEVLYTHTSSLGGAGGVVPAVAADRLELRVYTGFPRR